jgi:hypothetical protein
VPRLLFCMPAHGRLQLARICMRQLRRTCDALCAEGIEASAIVVATDENLDSAREFGFGTVERDNRFLARRFNDALQLAFDRRHNRHPADYAVPIGSDDWVDHRLFVDLPPQHTMVGFQRLAVVREDGLELTVRHLNYTGGTGIRIWPRSLLEPLGYRPADEDRRRACDTSLLLNVTRRVAINIMHHHLHDFQIVDWKSPVEQLNGYDMLAGYRGRTVTDPFKALAGVYPQEALAEMQTLYAYRALVAA